MDKPPFDPSQPFDVADKPAFDPSKPFDAAPSVGMGEDAAKSVGSGLASATIGTLGMGGDIRELAGKGLDLAGSKLGFDPSGIKSVASMASNVIPGLGLLKNAPTSADVKSTVTDPIVSPDYQPQYESGRLLKKGAEFAPNMLLGGPEGLGARFLTNVAAPAIGSEIGGQVAGPLGEIAGGLVGAGGATAAARKFQAMAAARNATKAIPAAEDLLKSGSSGFEAVKSSDAIIKPSTVEQIAKDIKTELLNDGKHPTSEGQAGIFNALDRLEAMGKSGGGVTTKDMEVIRKNLVDQKTSLNPSVSQAARQATESFMQKYSNLGTNDLLHGSNPFPALKNAIGDWAAGKRSNAVTGKMDLAKLNSGTAGIGANDDNAMRQAIKQLARPMNNTNVPVARKLGFNGPEVDAVKQAAMGTPIGNVARFVGKAAPTGIVSGALSGSAGHAVGGPIGAIALPAVGYVAKKIGDLSTKRAVSALDSLVRSRSPLAAQVAAQLAPQVVNQLPSKTQRILQALSISAPTVRQQIPQSVGQPVGQSSGY
jgi:hypothetical protein